MGAPKIRPTGRQKKTVPKSIVMLGVSPLAGRESGTGLLSHARPIHTGHPGSFSSLADVLQNKNEYKKKTGTKTKTITTKQKQKQKQLQIQKKTNTQQKQQHLTNTKT